MFTLMITPKGQVTLPKEVLTHLGIQSGAKVEVSLLPAGRVELSAPQKRESISRLHGLLQGKTNGAKLSIEEINESSRPYNPR